jgi:hypothetical protein
LAEPTLQHCKLAGAPLFGVIFEGSIDRPDLVGFGRFDFRIEKLIPDIELEIRLPKNFDELSATLQPEIIEEPARGYFKDGAILWLNSSELRSSEVDPVEPVESVEPNAEL